MNAVLAADIQAGASTRSAKLKWVIVADPSRGPGLVANATACLGAAAAAVLPDLIGGEVEDASGHVHAGLPWSGCSILAADAGKLHEIRAKAATKEGVFIADMTKHAQASRSYEEYRAGLGETGEGDLEYYAVGLIGPRNKIAKLVGGLPLLS